MFINCTYCKGNKVTTPMGGIEKKCIECNGIGYLECVTDTSTKKGKAEARVKACRRKSNRANGCQSERAR